MHGGNPLGRDGARQMFGAGDELGMLGFIAWGCVV